MSTIFLRSNKIYYLVVDSPNGTRRWISTKTRNRSEALRKLAEYELNAIQQYSSPKLSEFIPELLYYVKNNFAPGTLNIYQKSFNTFFRHIGDIYIDKINHRHIDQFKSQRLETRKKTTVNIEIRALRAGFETALRWQLIKFNPFKGIKNCPVDEAMPLFISPDEYRLLLQNVQELWLKQMIVLGTLTGLRRNELLYLQWKNIDFNNRILYVFSTPTFRTKNGKKRIVPLNDTAFKLIHHCYEVRTNDFVFSFPNGVPVAPQHVSRMFKRYVRKLGLNPELKYHSLRHSFASWLVQKGASLYEVQKLLGHSNPRVTEIYSHLLPNTMHHVVQSIDPAM